MNSRAVTVLPPSVEGLSVSALIDVGERSHRVSFRASQGPVTRRSDPFIPLALPAAMRLGAPLIIEGTVSSMLMTAVPKIQDILMGWDMQEWWHGLARVPVEASHVARGNSISLCIAGNIHHGDMIERQVSTPH